MPNWCSNRIVVLGPDDEVERLRLAVIADDGADGQEATPLDFERIIPIGQTDDWYEQRTSRWGTKWNASDACSSYVDTGRKSLSVLWYRYETAWAPSLPVTVALSESFPTLRIVHEYSEPGMAFAGVHLFLAGEEITSHECDDSVELLLTVAPGCVVAHPGWRSEQVLTCSPGLEAQAIRASLEDLDPFRSDAVLLDAMADAPEVELFSHMSTDQLVPAVDCPDGQARLDSWLGEQYSGSRVINDWLQSFDPASPECTAADLAVYTCLSLANGNGFGYQWWESNGDPASTKFSFADWKAAFARALDARVHPPVALALVEELAEHADSADALGSSLIEIAARAA